MIRLPGGELRDFLPVTMKNDVDMICLSYAIQKATERLMQYNRASMIYHFIDSVPEPILDLLAAELRSLYYSDTLQLEKKREIVKNTLRWHSQAGTPGAVSEMINIVFGEGEVVEWPDFNEPPYTPGTFDIVTKAGLTPGTLSYFASVIDRVKNVRSHLRRLLIKRECSQQVYAGVGNKIVIKPAVVTDGYRQLDRKRQPIYAGTACYTISWTPPVIDGCWQSHTVGQGFYAGIEGTQFYKQAVFIEQGGSGCRSHFKMQL